MKIIPDSFKSEKINRIFLTGLIFMVVTGFNGIMADQNQPSDRSPTSIMFLLDVSVSNNNTDFDGERFRILNKIIDSLHTLDSEFMMGLIMFTSKLWFYPADDPLFIDVPGSVGGCVPLLNTGQNYSGVYTQADRFGSIISKTDYSKSGYEILKMYADTARNQVFGIEPKYRPTSSQAASTDLTIAFNGAKHAMSQSPHDKERQFIVLFSDGGGDNSDFVQGIDVPTTFTFYYNPQDPLDLSELSQMTSNVQNNLYSSVNHKSNLWDMSMGFDGVITNLLQNIHETDKIPELIPVTSPTFERRPTFTWHEPESFVSEYTIQIDTMGDFSSSIVHVPLTDTVYTPVVDLPIGTIYWRVRGESSPWSGAGGFIIQDPVPNIVNNTNINAFVPRHMANVEVYNAVGRLVKELNRVPGEYNSLIAEISDKKKMNLSEGLYFISYKYGEQFYLKKVFLKNR